MKIGLILVFIVTLISVGMGQQRVIEDLKPGPVTIDLGGGYEISFELPDIESSYSAEIYEPVTNELFGKSTVYSAFIVGSDSNEQLAKILLQKWDKTPPPSSKDQTIPLTIDGHYGFVFYHWYEDTSLDPKKAVAAELTYYPGSVDTPDKTHVKGDIDMSVGVANYKPGGLGYRYDLFQFIVDSIQVSGPGI